MRQALHAGGDTPGTDLHERDDVIHDVGGPEADVGAGERRGVRTRLLRLNGKTSRNIHFRF